MDMKIEVTRKMRKSVTRFSRKKFQTPLRAQHNIEETKSSREKNITHTQQ
jgi:hypothetical protein